MQVLERPRNLSKRLQKRLWTVPSCFLFRLLAFLESCLWALPAWEQLGGLQIPRRWNKIIRLQGRKKKKAGEFRARRGEGGQKDCKADPFHSSLPNRMPPFSPPSASHPPADQSQLSGIGRKSSGEPSPFSVVPCLGNLYGLNALPAKGGGIKERERVTASGQEEKLCEGALYTILDHWFLAIALRCLFWLAAREVLPHPNCWEIPFYRRGFKKKSVQRMYSPQELQGCRRISGEDLPGTKTWSFSALPPATLLWLESNNTNQKQMSWARGAFWMDVCHIILIFSRSKEDSPIE